MSVEVYFNDAPGRSVVVDGDTQLRCILPPGKPGNGTVKVSTGGGTAHAGWAYLGITKIAPTWGRPKKLFMVEIHLGGIASREVRLVTICGVKCSAIEYYDSYVSVELDVLPSKPGTGDVVVYDRDLREVARRNNGFTVVESGSEVT